MRLVLPVTCCLVLSTVPVWAQPPADGGSGRGGRFGGMRSSSPAMLLGQESVQKDLSLSPEQIQAINSISEQRRAAMSEAFQLDRSERDQRMQEISKQSDAMIGQVLGPQQLKRLNEISVQQQGSRAFSQSETAQLLGLSPDQMANIQKLQEEGDAEAQAAMRKASEEARAATEQKIMALFTPEQQEKWSQVRGQKFEGEIVRPSFGGRGGPGLGGPDGSGGNDPSGSAASSFVPARAARTAPATSRGTRATPVKPTVKRPVPAKRSPTTAKPTNDNP
jgi:hypothetical protein